MSRRRLWVCAALAPCLLVPGLLLPLIGHTAALADLTISSPAQVVHWSGHNPDPTGQGYQPPTDATCTAQSAAQTQTPAPCDLLTLHVALDLPYALKGPVSVSPQGITKDQPYSEMPGDGILVSVKWATDFDQWNLYVDDASGAPVGSVQCAQATVPSTTATGCGTDVDSNAQSVLVPPPAGAVDAATNQTHWHTDYTVKVIPFYTDFVPGDTAYAGDARLFLDPAQRTAPRRLLLPKIETVAPNNFHVDSIPPIPSNPTGWRFTPPGTFPTSCYADETAQFGSTRCLRFDNDIRNVGDGPLTLEFNYDPGALATAVQNATNIPAGRCHMNQELLWSDGSAQLQDAGPCIFHTQHLHFHYQNMGRYQLFAVHADGTTGAIPVPGQGQVGARPVAVSYKVGFCTVDVDDFTFGTAAARPRTFSFPTCNVPNGYATPAQAITNPSAQYAGAPEFMGISPGWGDVYTWDLPNQYIDISHVPDGVYEVASSSNFDGGLRAVQDRSAETGVSCIRISTAASTSPPLTKVTVLQTLPSQASSVPLPVCTAARTAVTAPAPAQNAAAQGASSLPNTSHGEGSAQPLGATALVAALAGLGARRRRNRHP